MLLLRAKLRTRTQMNEQKTADYHRHIFGPPALLKTYFRRMKTLFLEKNPFQILENRTFEIFPNFIFFAKTSQLRLKNNLENILKK